MKKVISIFIVFALLISMAPMANATVTTGTPALVFRCMYRDANGVLCEDPNNESFMNTRLGDDPLVRFYFSDGSTYTMLESDVLSISNTSVISLEQQEDTDCTRFVAQECGDSTITYTYKDTDYSVSATVVLPDYGLYTDVAASSSAFIRYDTGFAVSETNKDFYLVGANGCTISTVKLNEDLDLIADVAVSNDGTYATISVTGTPENHWYYLSCEGKNSTGATVTRDLGLELINNIPAAGVRFANINYDAGFSEPVSQFITEPGNSIDSEPAVIFYYGTSNSYVPIESVESVVAEDSTIVNVVCGYATTDGYPSYKLNIIKPGTTNLVVTTTGGTKYSVPYRVDMNNPWLFSDSNFDPDTVITSFTVTEDSDTFYFVCEDGYKMDEVSVEERYAGAFAIERVSDTAFSIQVVTPAKLPSNNRVCLMAEFSSSSDPTESESFETRFKIVNTIPATGIRYCQRQNNSLTVRANSAFATAPEDGIASRPVIVFFYGTADSYVPITDIENVTVSNPSILAVSYCEDTAEGYPAYELNYLKPGTTNIIITTSAGTTYSIPFTVGLTNPWLFSNATFDPNYAITSFTITEDEDTFYYVCEDGFEMDEVFVEEEYADAFEINRVSDTAFSIQVIKPDQIPDGNHVQITANYSNSDWSDSFDVWFEINNNAPSAGVLYTYWDANQNLVFNSDFGFQSSMSNSIGSNPCVVFSYGTSSSNTPIANIESVVAEDPTLVSIVKCEETINGHPVYQMRHLKGGSTSLIVTTKDGTKYCIPYNIHINSVWAFSDATYDPNTVITSFTVTEDSDTFYFVCEDGWNLTSLSAIETYADAFSIEKVSATAYSVQVVNPSMVPSGYMVAFFATFSDSSGDRVNTFDVWLTINDATPGLKYRHMAWDKATNSFYEDETRPLLSQWNTEMGSGAPVKFYLAAGSDIKAVSLSDLTFPEGIATGEQEEGNDYIDISAVGFGSGNIAYTVGEGESAKTYTLPVTVGLPSYGFYSTQTASQESYLSVIKVTELPYTFYFVANDGGTINDVSPGLTDIASATKVSDTCWAVTLTGTPDGNWFSVKYSWTDQRGNEFTDWKNVRIVNAVPHLMFRYMETTNGQWVESTRMAEWNELSFAYYQTNFIRPYYGTEDDYIAVSEMEVAFGDSIVLVEKTDANGVPFWTIKGVAFGTSTLSYKVGDKTYTQNVTVGMANPWFYSAQERSEKYYLASINYRDLTDGVLWVLQDGGFTAEEADALTILQDNTPITTWEKVAWTSDATRYDVKITLPEIEINEWYHLLVKFGGGGGIGNSVDNYVSGNAAYVGDYAIGFAWEDEETGIIRINEGNWQHGGGANVMDDNYREFRTLQIAAGVKKTDEQGAVYYVVDKNSENVDLKILRVWVEEVSGTEKVFSMSADGHQQEKTDYAGTDVQLYAKLGYNALVLIRAEVEITVGDTTETTQVGMLCHTSFVGNVTVDRPMDDTVDKLNAYLAELAKTLESGTQYTVNLAPIEYNGTIIIPSEFEAGGLDGTDLIIRGAQADDGSQTIVNGAVNLNRATTSTLENIHFRATEDCTTAIYGGALLNMANCSFTNYSIAVDATIGAITVTNGNVFINNDIAVRVDIENVYGGMNASPWSNNTFINNGTAVQVLSLNDFISSYYFRIVNSNFINNGIDFDVRCKATLYMYKNYYGQYTEKDGHRPTPGKHHNDRHNGRDHLRLDELLGAKTLTKLNEVLESRGAIVSTSNGAKVITNPRWKHPVKNWWGHENILVSDALFGREITSTATPMSQDQEEEYEDVLISDWELETQIVNEEAKNLIVDSSAFEEEGEKQIDVVDQQEKPVGTWTFD